METELKIVKAKYTDPLGLLKNTPQAKAERAAAEDKLNQAQQELVKLDDEIKKSKTTTPATTTTGGDEVKTTTPATTTTGGDEVKTTTPATTTTGGDEGKTTTPATTTGGVEDKVKAAEKAGVVVRNLEKQLERAQNCRSH